MSELHNEGQMTHAEAAAAISEAVSSDPEFTPGLPAEGIAPDETPADQAADTPTPGADDAPDPGATDFAAAAVDEDSLWAGSDINPDLLPDELKPLAKQFEAAYTRKTQSLAEQRKQIEELGDVEALTQARDFYASLQDPEFLKNFYGELGGVVQELGLVEAPQAEPAAPVVPAEPAALSPELQKLVDSDPELTPLAQQLNSMQSELAEFRQAQAAEREALENERVLMSQAAAIDQQVQKIRQAHPEYDEADWQDIYDLSVARDGNVNEGAKQFEAQRERIISAYVAKKTAAPAAPVPGGGVIAEDVEPEQEGLRTFAQADIDAQAYLDANDLAEFNG